MKCSASSLFFARKRAFLARKAAKINIKRQRGGGLYGCLFLKKTFEERNLVEVCIDA
jgi:hypothetical protein